MRILILGGNGMLGHQLLMYLQARHDVYVTLRQNIGEYSSLNLFNKKNAYDSIDVRSVDSLIAVMADCKPAVVINAVGIIKQRPDSKESIPRL